MTIKTEKIVFGQPANRQKLTEGVYHSHPQQQAAPGDGLTDEELQQQIADAAQAERELAEEQEKRRKAAKLDALRRESEKRARIKQAEAHLDAAVPVIAEELGRIKPKVRKWQSEVQALDEQINRLAAEGKALNREILDAAKRLQQAVHAAAYAHDPHYIPDSPLSPSSVASFDELWEQAGGNDPGLSMSLAGKGLSERTKTAILGDGLFYTGIAYIKKLQRYFKSF